MRSATLASILSLAALTVLPVRSPSQVTGHVHTNRSDARVLPLAREEGVFHFVIYGDRTGGPKEGIRVLEQAVADTKLLDPDLVMTVGDLVQGYNSLEPWLEEMREFKGVMDKLPCAWFPVAGNHDVYWRGPKPPVGEHERDYETHFGPLWYWFEHKNAAFFVLYTDEGDPKDGSKGIGQSRHQQMSPEQIAWLRAELAKVKDKRHVFVFCHHPRWIDSRYPENNWWKDVHTLLAAAGNVTAVFGGHIHRIVYTGKRDGIEYHALATTGGHLNEENAPQLGYVHHLHVVTVREGGIQVATLPVGAVFDPKQLTEERLRELDELRSMSFAASDGPIEVASDGSALGIYATRIENTTSHPIEVTLTPQLDSGRWSFGPDHVHAVIAPGTERRLAFAVARQARGFEDFTVPEALVHVDWLADAGRVSLPERRLVLPLSFVGVEDRPFDPGRSGALSFTGGASAVTVDSKKLALPDGPFTVECWVRPTSLDGRRGLIGQADQSEFGLFASDATLDFSVHLDGQYKRVKTDPGTLSLGAWQHVAGVFDGHELRLYLNGLLLGRTAATGKRSRNALPFVIGADTGRRGPNSGIEGLVDEVRVSTGARYEDADFEAPRRLTADDKTVLLLHCDEHYGPYVLDVSGRAAHGQLRSGAKIDRVRFVDAR